MEHLAEQAHGGVRAAQGIGDVVVHVALVGGQPVHLGAIGGEHLVVRAEGQLRHHVAGGVLALQGDDRVGHRQSAGDHGVGLPARTHDHRRLHRAGVADEVRPGQKRAHAVAHDAQGRVGVFLPQPLVQHINIVHHRVPGVALAEIHRRAALGQGLAVAQVVVARHNDALLVQRPGKGVIAGDMLRHAVAHLQHRPHRRVGRLPQHPVKLRMAIAGQELELGHIRHGNPAPFML